MNMVNLLDATGRRRVVTSLEKRSTAQLLSIRQNLHHQACIGVDGIDQLESRFSQNLANAVMNQVRGFLNTEFGQLRVHRYRQVFSVGHYSLESLIAGLFRVQFYARQVQLPAIEGVSEPALLSLSWGVGESIQKAEQERQRRSSLKR
ncbi:hypothetical protein [Granulosicoccus antarcticus]|uniref:hypothetical protein n=1 Tax=Granulosicoccus antarcticus TaxID=437505 RepID=UPI0012FE533E|nr:hypothetical protein [Granulosicoccus antarcticus]